MALIYDAELRPGKLELISDWLPRARWFPSTEPVTARKLGAFRFEDPEGAVGIETLIVAAGSLVVQVPLTYRDAPLAGAERFLITEMDHSVLGRRWVYDAAGDPVYAAALEAALFSRQGQAPQYTERDGVRELLPESMRVFTSGMPDGAELADAPAEEPQDWTVSVLERSGWELSVVRLLDLDGRTAPDPSLQATWEGQDFPVVLAWGMPNAG
ncbi:hypothetical protein LJ753_03830 [Arthrobacter sp. zg-Y20]|uniref:maltokinase N-terminal cap-like domain-containing protein n=1 Tax=unclassified Arthrobacter TaxID=235627 RepID=UPI001D159147|nr:MULTISPECIES: hypothetical protein [unclassified Arthrobacter]MCC3275001.1 hypothetical protein [Arthrobacter sp. zg-Y20]MDK1315158.1 hypothetical protein [Arthrobacter sp. zg.Y20]WIB04998.1 hypothetical protein QNO06_10575 [Arthrobacter sp. zg-Y20]